MSLGVFKKTVLIDIWNISVKREWEMVRLVKATDPPLQTMNLEPGTLQEVITTLVMFMSSYLSNVLLSEINMLIRELEL